MVGKTISHYQILEKLGEGGMGVVWKAEDTRLGRLVALKFLPAEAVADTNLRQRLLHEAQAAAALDHPNICTVYEIDEQNGEIFLAMAYVDGPTLEKKIEQRPLKLEEAIDIALQIGEGLELAHERAVVHRDIKSSNVLLTARGQVKITDFGLAMLGNRTRLTQDGAILGTPGYMSPEQAQGLPADTRSDIWSLGVVLYEMVSGQLPFHGETAPAQIFAILCNEPEPLTALRSGVPMELDRVVAKALAKTAGNRYQHMADMLVDLRSVKRRLAVRPPSSGPARVESREKLGEGSQAALPVKRLMVLPFRLLRADPDIDFLAFGLADAITGSLSSLEQLVVRSSLAAARYAGETDLKRIAGEADVHLVLAGTLLRSGDQLRVSTQLVEGASGTVVSSQTSQGCLRDIFQLQDQIVGRVVSSLALPLSTREQDLLSRDVPASPAAYETYLRANQLAYTYGCLSVARGLYIRCVEEDPNYAPAWARLGRCYRVNAKFGGDPEDFPRAETALGRALVLNADLALAHNQLAYLEADSGRAEQAMVRLLLRAKTTRSDPELFAGLVHVCRFCGLLGASVAAHQLACRLDTGVRTSVCHTYFMRGDYFLALETSNEVRGYLGPLALVFLGRDQEALELAREDHSGELPLANCLYSSVRLLLEGDRAAAVEMCERAIALITYGPEELLYLARHLAYLGETERAVVILNRAVDGGFFCHQMLAGDAWLHPLRATPGFAGILERAFQRHTIAARRFVEAGGERILGALQ